MNKTPKVTDTAKMVKNWFQQNPASDRYVAQLDTRSASRTVAALKADDYGCVLNLDLGNGTQLWTIYGSAE
jgi:hypothetical protein